jgi:lysozyme
MTFDQFYNHVGPFRNFKSHEWLVKGGAHTNRRHSGFGLNTDPPPDLWEDAIPLFHLVDKLRTACGSRIAITSAYRSPAYNRAIGGAGESWHTRFQAADLIPLDISVAQLWQAAISFRADGHFRGGIGRYRTFVHVDVRGRNANW